MTSADSRSADNSATTATAANGERVMLLVDYDNFSTQCAGRGLPLEPKRLIERARQYGRLTWSAVFVDVVRLTLEERLALFHAGFMVSDCPKLPTRNTAYRKDTVDSSIIQVMYHAAEFLPVDVVILASADRDFLRPIYDLRNVGKRVLIFTPTRFESPELLQAADGQAIYHFAAENAGGVLPVVASLFQNGRYDTSDLDGAGCAYVRSLAAMVWIMDDQFQVNSGRFGFNLLKRRLGDHPTIRAMGLDQEALHQRLEFLVDGGVLVKQPYRVGVRNGDSSDRGERYRYTVDDRHTFVLGYVRTQFARVGDDADELVAPWSAPDGATGGAVAAS